MGEKLPGRQDGTPSGRAGDVTEKLRRSRQRLLDLTLRNRLLNFRPGGPDYRDNLKTHKHLVLKGLVDPLWRALVEEEKDIEVVGLSRDQQAQLAREIQSQSKARPPAEDPISLSLARIGNEEWEDVRGSIRGVSQILQQGNLLSLLPEELFRNRLTKIRNEQNTLTNSTGDSALFLAIGFLEWREVEPHPKAHERLFAPLILVHVSLEQRKREEGGEREFRLHMDADQPQSNPCLAEKLRQDHAVDLPELNVEADETASEYLNRVRRAIRSKKDWLVHPTVALGFFNFARYRLWLDLNPAEWPQGRSPADHAIVGAILNAQPLPQQNGVPDEDAVARHQESEDLPLVMDADSTQYAALLAAQKGVSLVVEGPPGSGKSQTITNLIAIALAQGKRVLFVAQKLPALQVVQRRLESVELASFCLPLFSDKARATEVHKHLAGGVRWRDRPDRSPSQHNPALAIAQQLNSHATRLRGRPPGSSQTVSSLIQRAVALNLLVREEWGAAWHDDLLEVSAPGTEPGVEWFQKREQCLHNWHRFKADAGNVWSHWNPLLLMSADVQPVRAAVHSQLQAAEALAKSLALLPEEFHASTIAGIKRLVSQVGQCRFSVLKEVLPGLLGFLQQARGNAALVVGLENDLEAFSNYLSAAQKHLRFSTGNWQDVAALLTEALKALEPFFSPGCSLASARAAVAELDEILEATAELAACADAQPAGVIALLPPEDSSTREPALTWGHVELLAKQTAGAGLSVPNDIKAPLALYLSGDASRLNDAWELSTQLARLHEASARLSSRTSNPARLWQGNAVQALSASLDGLCRHGFAASSLVDLPRLQAAFSAAAASLAKAGGKLPGEFLADVFGQETPTVGVYRKLGKLADMPAESLRIPSGGVEEVLRRAVGMAGPALALRSFSEAVRRHQQLHQEVVSWFPSLQLGEPVDSSTLGDCVQAVQAGHDLGLHEQSLASLPSLARDLARVRTLLEGTMEQCRRQFEPWPILAPETLGQLHEAKGLFLLLTNRPAAPPELPLESLCQATHMQAVTAAAAESEELQQWRQQNSGRVAFRDLPDAESLAAHRRELRPVAGVWWRWFSPRYHKTRKATQSFLHRPFPSDEAALTLLGELEDHQQHCDRLLASPAASLLGGLFQGVETRWQVIQPTMDWIHQLQAATQAKDLAAFAKSSLQHADPLRSAHKAIEILEQFLDLNRPALVALAPLSGLLSNPHSAKITDLCEALSRAESLATKLADHIPVQARPHPKATFADLASRCQRLEEFHQSFEALKSHAALAVPASAAALQTGALDAAADWVSRMLEQGMSLELLRALVGGALKFEVHAPLFPIAREVVQHADGFERCLPSGEAASWLAQEVPGPSLEATLGTLADSAAAAGRLAPECTFHDHLTLGEVADALRDVQAIVALKQGMVPWQQILREEPCEITSAQISDTIQWFEGLRSHGASLPLLRWILSEQAQSRLQWWQGLVARAQSLKARIAQLKARLPLPLEEAHPTLPLMAWMSRVAERSAGFCNALDHLALHTNSDTVAMQDLARSNVALGRAVQLEAEFQGWHARIGVHPAQVGAARIKSHRLWVTLAHSLPAPVQDWLVSADTTSRCEALVGLERKLTALQNAVAATRACLSNFGELTGEGPFDILSSAGTHHDVIRRCSALLDGLPLLPHYASLLSERAKAQGLGLGELLRHAEQAGISSETLIQTFRGAVAWQQAKTVRQADEGLLRFQSRDHERLRSEFQDADASQLKANRRVVRARISSRRVTKGIQGKAAGEHTELALLKHEMNKQRRHVPIRKLVSRAGGAMQDLCPCWMMTPLAVAQFLPPGEIGFDVVIMDEASQINPEDAWGAIARGRQVIVVGDRKQMPPSDFFMSALDEDESLEDGDIDGGESESILGASVAALASSSLLWHYRSRQETLIAPANRFSYDNRLVLFPHPHRSDPELGIRYRYIEGATTTTGKVVNALEAEAVARRVRELVLAEYAKPHSARLTIGVVTMNLSQQDAVLDLLDKMRQDDPRFDLAFSALTSERNEEPLFVRNLENIQGDERDVMILSCTYGPATPGGTPAQRFGPLNRQGGERRFNVLITRAKWRMEVFASLRSDQIVVDGKQQGVRDFNLFLKYAETGQLSDPGESTERPSDSPFEVQVEAVLVRAGFQVERQVGVAGYFIDLGVKHPHNPGLFALGIECDGATYHGSRAARDRDRLRERILAERGWKLHRIWSTDWFVEPLQAKQRLLDAVREACKL